MHTLTKKDSIYTLTVAIPSLLASSLVVDTSELPSSFAAAVRPSSSSSSYGTRTALPILAIVAPPMVMFLPQMNA